MGPGPERLDVSDPRADARPVPEAARRLLEETELVDLHIHVGAAVAPHVLWEIAHDHGFKLPVRTYPEFQDLVYADPDRVKSLDGYLDILHRWTERIQSSPAAIERSVYSIIGKEYRSSRVSTIELRFNPMKRNLGGERDLDHIITAALHGMERACLAYGVRAGLIFCLAREFDYALNDIIVRKAERYRDRGVVGIDLAGPEQHTLEFGGDVDRYHDLFARARAAGLGTTIHTGETSHTGADGVVAVLEKLQPDRIGHGIAAARNEELMQRLATAARCSSCALRRTSGRTPSPAGRSCARSTSASGTPGSGPPSTPTARTSSARRSAASSSCSSSTGSWTSTMSCARSRPRGRRPSSGRRARPLGHVSLNARPRSRSQHLEGLL